MSIWHILISESVPVYGRYVVGLLSVWVRDCRSAVGYNSSSVVMIGFQSVSPCDVGYVSVSNRAIPHRILPEMTPTWTRLLLRCLQQHCRWPTAGRFIENFAHLSVSCRFGRCDWGISRSLPEFDDFCRFEEGFVSCRFSRCDWGIRQKCCPYTRD